MAVRRRPGASEGRAAGIVSALGIGVGTLVHIALVAAGLAALLTAVPMAHLALRFAGAACLVYLGVRALRGGAGTGGMDALEPAPLASIFRQGVTPTCSTPKARS